MYVAPLNTDHLLSEAEKENLYVKLVAQINKDLILPTKALIFLWSILPEELKIQLQEKIYRLIHISLPNI